MTTKNNKVPKSAKTRLSDLTPKKDARGGKVRPDGGPAGTAGAGPAGTPPGVFQTKNSVTSRRYSTI
jgi:hypothetical protein